jgi:acetyl-CoA decarbonylase/synthase complex subunit beta
VKDFIPAELIEKIATEEEAKTIDELKVFLSEHSHPVVERWKEAEAAPEETKEEAPLIPVATAATLPITAGGYKIILKNAKIYAKKVIIRSTKTEEK